MILFAVLAVLLPWSLWRQMHEHAVTRGGLIKLPLIFAGVGVLAFQHDEIPSTAAAAAYLAVSLGLSTALGAWRGAIMPTWRDDAGQWMTKGDRRTIALWIALIAIKFVLGAIASITGWFPSSSPGEVFLFLGISFAVQNLVVAHRTLDRAPVPVMS